MLGTFPTGSLGLNLPVPTGTVPTPVYTTYFSTSPLPNLIWAFPFLHQIFPLFYLIYPLALLSGQLSRHSHLNIKHQPNPMLPQSLFPIYLLCCIRGCHHGEDGWQHCDCSFVCPYPISI
jgi:hypothetical protein